MTQHLGWKAAWARTAKDTATKASASSPTSATHPHRAGRMPERRFESRKGQMYFGYELNLKSTTQEEFRQAYQELAASAV